MNKIDQIISTNICTSFMLLVCISLFFFSTSLNLAEFKYFIYFVITLISLFNLKVLTKKYQRIKLYEILTSRIKNDGYSKEIFQGKCTTICSLSMNIYIVLRVGKMTDLKYLYKQFKSGHSKAIHEDKDIEDAINNFVFKN